MKTVTGRLYEAMFLVDSSEAASDWEGILGLITSLLEKNEAEIVSLRKWDERHLAYAIDGKNRGTYILCYFKCSGSTLGQIERSVKLSERLMRVLILNAEHMTQEDIEADTPVLKAEKAAAAALEAKETKEAESASEEIASVDEVALVDVIEGVTSAAYADSELESAPETESESAEPELAEEDEEKDVQ